MKRLAVFIFVAMLLAGCKHDTFTISGTIEGGEGKTLWLEEIAPEGVLFIDSIPLDSKGHFKFTYKMPYRSLYNLHTSENNYIVTLPDYGEKLVVSGDWSNLSMTYDVSGSPESALLWQLQQYTNDGGKVIGELVDTTEHYAKLYASGVVGADVVAAKKEETDSIYRLVFKEQRDYVCHFIENNKGSLSTLIALYKPFNNRMLIDTRDPQCIDWYDEVLEGLEERYPYNPHTLHFRNTTEHLRSALER